MNSSDVSSTDPSVIGVLYSIGENRFLFSSIVAAFFVLSTFIAFMMTPVYRATVLLAPSEQASLGQGLAASSGAASLLASVSGINLGGMSSKKDETIAILRSRAFTMDFIEENDLLKVIFSDKWDSDEEQWIVDGPSDSPPTLYEGFRKFDRDVRHVSEDRVTGLITVSIDWPDRPIAAEWANQIVRRLNTYVAEKAVSEGRKSIEFLQAELAKTDVQGVRDSIFGLIQAQLNNIMVANASDEFAVRVIDPATVPTKYDKVRPKKALMMIVGILIGVLIATIVIVLRESLASRPPEARLSS